MPKVLFSQVLLGLDGKTPIKDQEGPSAKDFTLAMAASTALLTPFPEEHNLSGDEKAKRFRLALRISDGGAHELTIEEVAQIKLLIAKSFAPLIVGRAYEILDPPTS